MLLESKVCSHLKASTGVYISLWAGQHLCIICQVSIELTSMYALLIYIIYIMCRWKYQKIFFDNYMFFTETNGCKRNRK